MPVTAAQAAINAAIAAAGKPRRKRRPPVDLGEVLAKQLQLAGVITPMREFRFHPIRQWRIDLAWPHIRLAVECEGFSQGGKAGRHQRTEHMHANCEKHCALAVMGWRLMRVTGAQIRTGIALKWIEAALAIDAQGEAFNAIHPLSIVRKKAKPEQWTDAELADLQAQRAAPIRFNRVRGWRG